MKNIRRWGPGLLLVSPSIILITIFVYGLIGWNIKVSLSNWRQAQPTSHYAGLGAYRDLAHDAQFRLTLAHLLIFTIVFALGTLIIGWTLALLLDKGVKGEGFFRAVYLLRTGGPDGERIGVALQRSLWLASGATQIRDRAVFTTFLGTS